VSAALEALAATVRADGGLLADTVTDPTQDAPLGELAGAGYEELVEAIDILAGVISRAAQAHAEGDPGAASAAWEAGARAVGRSARQSAS